VAVQPKVPQPSAGSYLGAESCAASGCHGKAFDGTRNWKSAWSIWFAEDPHRRAGDVLYSERSVEMYRNLHALEQQAERVDEDRYSAFLQQRCAGCHANPVAGKSATLAQHGVSCESCHGPASTWIDRHYLANWNGAEGFHDLKNLPARAAVCAACHVGPVVADGITFEIDHELIAAGHPRLTFELDAYLANYPKHWDETADRARYPGSFHTNAWLCGQLASSSKLIEQLASRQQPQPEFSNYDCIGCHHALRVRGDAHLGFPRPALLPLAQLAAVTQQSTDLPWHSLLRQAETNLARPWTEAESRPLTAADSQLPAVNLLSASDLPTHAAALRRIPPGWTDDGRASPTWDQAVQFYLAVQALRRDLPMELQWSLATAAEQLAAALGPQNFAGHLPTQYDSPATFDASTLTTPLAEVDRALAEIANPIQLAP
jgi:ribosomal protein S27E